MGLEIQVASMPTTFDGLVTENFEQWTIVYNLADRLVEYGSKGELQTNLARSYRVSPDGKEYVFEIASDRRFHNGEPITAEDVVFSLGLSLRNEHSYSNLKDQIACESSVKDSGCSGISALSDREIRIRLRERNPTFLDKLNMNENAIRSKKEHLSGKIVYSGPYQIIKRDGQQISLQLNDRHPKAASGAFSRIEVTTLPTEVGAFEERLLTPARPVVMINKGFPTMLSKAGKLPLNAAYQFASGNSFLLSLRPDIPQLEQIRYLTQRAILAPGALDEFPYLKPLAAIYPPGYALSTPTFFASQGLTPTKMVQPLLIKVPAGGLGRELKKHLTTLLARQGVTVTLMEVDAATYKAQLAGSEYDGMLAFPFIDIQDEVRVARGYFSGYWNYFSSPKANLLRLLSEADASTDPDLRMSKMRDFYRKLLTEYPIVPLFFTANMILLSESIDRSQLEYYGNTMKFELFKRKES